MTVALGALALVVLAALTIPVRVESTATAGGLGQDLARPALEAVQAEDLGLFVASRRWDVVLQDLLDEAARKAAEAAAAAAGQIVITPELAKIGFVGLMVEPDEYAVLLVLPGGKISRLAGG